MARFNAAANDVQARYGTSSKAASEDLLLKPIAVAAMASHRVIANDGGLSEKYARVPQWPQVRPLHKGMRKNVNAWHNNGPSVDVGRRRLPVNGNLPLK